MQKIVGYGLTTCGEADRYMENTMKEFARICDDAIILVNGNKENCKKEIALIEKYGFKWVCDERLWGEKQWLIKQDFVQNEVSKLNPTYCACLDMDETYDSRFTRESIKELEKIGDAFHFFICDLWGEGWKEKSSFWNVRLWKFKPPFTFKQTPVHCGLAPEWAYHHHYFAPYIVKHYGLKKKEDRQRKIERYEKYDPTQKFLDPMYYRMLKSDTFEPFDEDKVKNIISKEVATYQQRPKKFMEPKERKFVYFKTKDGTVIDVPAEQINNYLSQSGLVYIGTKDQMDLEMEEIFKAPTGTVGELIGILVEKTFAAGTEIELDNETKKPINELQCQCGYKAKNKAGLKAHQRIKHKNA